MKNWLLIALLLIGCISYSVFAQPGGPPPRPGQGGGMQPYPGQGQEPGFNPDFQDRGSQPFQGQMPPPRPVMQCNSNGVFILQGDILMKLDPKTLNKKGEAQILGKQRGKMNDRGPERDMAPMGPQGPAEMILSGTNLLLVAGDRFIRIDTASFKKQAECELPSMIRPDNPPREERGGQEPMRDDQMGNRQREPMQDDQMGMMQREPMPMMSPMPELKLVGNTLYILRGQQIIAVNIDSGKVIADSNIMPQRRAMKENRPPE